MSDYVVVTTTTDNAEEAGRLAGSAVEARLTACAQISAPIIGGNPDHLAWIDQETAER